MSLLPVHKRWLAFINGVSGVHEGRVETMGTRAIELIVFERSVLQEMHSMRHDWHAFFPDVAELMEREAARAVEYQEVVEEEGTNIVTIDSFCENHNTEFLKGLEAMVEKGQKYFVEQCMTIAWSVLHLTDPFLGAHWAASFLRVLLADGVIEELDEEIFVAIKDNLAPSHPWSPDCPVYAYPTLRFGDYRQRIEAMWTKGVGAGAGERNEAIVAMIAAYGLHNPNIIDDLLLMSTGLLLDTLESKAYWAPSTPTKFYWPLFKDTFPALADMFNNNFSDVLIGSTAAEIMFTWTPRMGEAHSSTHAAARDIDFYANYRGSFARAYTYKPQQRKMSTSADLLRRMGDDEDAVRTRPFRNKSERVDMLHEMVSVGEQLTEAAKDKPYVTNKQLRKLSSKRVERETNAPRVLEEFLKNAKPKRVAHDATSVTAELRRYSASWINKTDTLPVIIIPPYVQYAKDPKWNKADKQRYLCSFAETDEDRATIMATRVHAREGDDDDYATINDLLVNHWTDHNQDLATLPDIVKEWGKQEAAEATAGGGDGETRRVRQRQQNQSATPASYEAASKDTNWRVPAIKAYLISETAVLGIAEEHIKSAQKKRGAGDLPVPAYYSLQEMLVLLWTKSNTPLDDLPNILATRNQTNPGV
jgi:hypothetical protein